MSACPHKEVRFCPLYHAAHVAYAGGCDDGRIGEGGCAVTRGLDYERARKRLEVSHFALVAEAEFAERWHARNEQRKRNMRQAGLQ